MYLPEERETVIRFDELEREVKRAKSMSLISDKIIKAAETQLKAYEMSQEYEGTYKQMPKLLGD